MLVIGITGGVGCGKSALLKELQKTVNCRVVFTDDVANEVKEPGGLCYNKIVSVLGADVLDADGAIDRRRMAERIFSDEALLLQVNAILHPAVREVADEIIRYERAKGAIDVLFVEAALLIENGYNDVVDEMWYVYASEETRRARLKKTRGYADEKIDDIMQKQLTDAAFRKGADFVIDNDKTLAEALSQAEKRLGELLS